MIQRGKGRGFIQKDNNLKVYSPRDAESPWVKVIAMHKDMKKGIGILQNNLFNGRLKWGQTVLFEEVAEDRIAEIQEVVTAIPNLKGWQTDF